VLLIGRLSGCDLHSGALESGARSRLALRFTVTNPFFDDRKSDCARDG
jgi:hypothetical protein